MHTSLRLLLAILMAAGTGPPLLAATTSTKGKKSSKSETSAKKTAPASTETTAKKTAPAEPVDEHPTTPVMTPAAVSTISVEDIRDFDKYPKQIQSLVQSSMALTRLDLGYLYGSHEPSKGGMDCSGTIYHVLHFQGLKGVPRQSDEMCNWVDKKSQLYLTPTATSFDSEEFAALKPGDLLFWTNSLETTRKLPVTHVMIYLGKLKKSGKHVVFGSSDGRSFNGERRSGVSVFDFSLPKPDSTKHFYGYGPTPGLMPVEPERPAIAAVTPPPAPKDSAVSKETPASKETTMVKEVVAAKKSPTPKPVASVTKETPAPENSRPPKESSAPKEEVRKAVGAETVAPSEPVSTKADIAEAKTSASDDDAKPAVRKTVVADAPSKAKTSSTKKRSTAAVSSTRRRTPPAPKKSAFQQRVDRTVSSVQRFFQR